MRLHLIIGGRTPVIALCRGAAFMVQVASGHVVAYASLVGCSALLVLALAVDGEWTPN
jgi:hypothetical protein